MFEYTDKDLGRIIVKPHKTARRFIARRDGDCIRLTVPYGFDLKRLPAMIAEMKPNLVQLKPPATKLIDENIDLQTHAFSVKIVRWRMADSCQMRLANQILTLYIPEKSDMTNPDIQWTIREMIRRAMRFEAKRILSCKTAFFAQKNGLEYHDVKINKSMGRWGSCSRKKRINFSFFLMLLPEKYIDYVVLHELAHTREMNHSDRFWQLLTRFCGEDAKKISQELKIFRSDWLEILKD